VLALINYVIFGAHVGRARSFTARPHRATFLLLLSGGEASEMLLRGVQATTCDVLLRLWTGTGVVWARIGAAMPHYLRGCLPLRTNTIPAPLLLENLAGFGKRRPKDRTGTAAMEVREILRGRLHCGR